MPITSWKTAISNEVFTRMQPVSLKCIHYLSMPLGFSIHVREDGVLHSKVTESLPLFNVKQISNNSAIGVKGSCSCQSFEIPFLRSQGGVEKEHGSVRSLLIQTPFLLPCGSQTLSLSILVKLFQRDESHQSAVLGDF